MLNGESGGEISSPDERPPVTSGHEPATCPFTVRDAMRERRWYKPIDELAATEIVRQTRASGTSNVDVHLLTADLNVLFSDMEAQHRLGLTTSRKSYKSLEAFASRITKLERDLITSLALQERLMHGGYGVGASDEVYQSLGQRVIDPDFPVWLDVRVKLTLPRLLTAISLMRRWAKAALNGPHISSSTSAIEMLIGQGLPHFYEKHFGKKFGAGTAGDRSADGPGIRFIRACLAAASVTRPDGKPYSVETIRTYWQNARKRRRRRAPDKSREKR
jgi:hypothetical protein